MNITIRTDASISIGTGHVIRCLTLANKLRLRGNDIGFICREESGNLIGLIQQNGYDVQLLPSGIDIDTDRNLTRILLEQTSPDWLIVDHYEIDAAWESSMRNAAGKIMVIDDLADRKHDCDLLLDQNYNDDNKRYRQLVPDTCTMLLGPGYSLMRPQFADVRTKIREHTGEIKRILIFMGGADPDNQTSEALRAIKMLGRPDISTDLIIGISNTNRSEIESLASTLSNTSCYYNVENMAELMNAADLCIGEGGTATWERCCLGLPSITVSIAENQISVVDNLVKSGAVVSAGWFRDITAKGLVGDLNFLLRHSGIVRQMSLKSQQLVDGKGTTRVVNCIINSPGPLLLRPATLDDCFSVYDWRSH
ncbi:MAG TPA: UDP-2,4-diacetamido-2,4,6-trideoxy-beta-L-altropyranose hydrolase, partial [Nitrospirae bacterium]|nr:UDP-2,4-diacetamido-2,4,6-trideoxy-beta-L-altropyranose hydrolase [Nitrospirota bacterium]